VYVGLESGDPGLLRWLEKPGTPEDAVSLVRALHEAGIEAGVIVLLGAGGTRFAEPHIAGTSRVLAEMDLGQRDVLYLSDYVADPSLAYAARAADAADLVPLGPAETGRQFARIARALEECGARSRLARYDIREFVY
jgi:hypothetical protein